MHIQHLERCRLASMTFICHELSRSVKVRVIGFYLSKAVKVKVIDFYSSKSVKVIYCYLSKAMKVKVRVIDGDFENSNNVS